jgi:hypothetical protein
MSKHTKSILFALTLFLLIYGFLWGKWYFIEDFGPYYGKLVPVPNEKPNQLFRVNSNLSLESYDPNKEHNFAIVVARDINGKVLWSLTPYDPEPIPDLSIRFTGSLRVPFTDTIRLKTEFHYGVNDPSPTPTLWLLERNGSFRNYFIFT